MHIVCAFKLLHMLESKAIQAVHAHVCTIPRHVHAHIHTLKVTHTCTSASLHLSHSYSRCVFACCMEAHLRGRCAWSWVRVQPQQHHLINIYLVNIYIKALCNLQGAACIDIISPRESRCTLFPSPLLGRAQSYTREAVKRTQEACKLPLLVHAS